MFRKFLFAAVASVCLLIPFATPTPAQAAHGRSVHARHVRHNYRYYRGGAAYYRHCR